MTQSCVLCFRVALYMGGWCALFVARACALFARFLLFLTHILYKGGWYALFVARACALFARFLLFLTHIQYTHTHSHSHTHQSRPKSLCSFLKKVTKCDGLDALILWCFHSEIRWCAWVPCPIRTERVENALRQCSQELM